MPWDTGESYVLVIICYWAKYMYLVPAVFSVRGTEIMIISVLIYSWIKYVYLVPVVLSVRGTKIMI